MFKLEARTATRGRKKEMLLEDALQLGAKFIELPEGENPPQTTEELEALKEKIKKASAILPDFAEQGRVAVWTQEPLEVCLFWR